MSPTSDTTTAGAKRAKTAEPPAATARSLWPLVAIVFVSNTCVMVLELVAGRMIAPYVGVSLYTWTSVIGVVLAGISLGNYLGGVVADLWESPRVLGLVFMVGGVAAFGILGTEQVGNRLPDWPVVVQILALTTAIFFVPSMLLGGVSPIVAKLAVRDLSRTGNTLGRIYAAGTVGSIVGTFATGFILISAFGTHTIVWGVALVLLVMGALLLIPWRGSSDGILGLLMVLMVIGGVGAYTAGRGALTSVCTRETNYFCIRVHDSTRDGKPMLELVLDRLVHSYSSLEDPTDLVYDYEKIFAEATAYLSQRRQSLSALFIGGGGYTFPRYMQTIYPDSKLDVIEIDPGVTEIAYERLGLKRNSSIISYNEDARQFMARRTPQAYDMVMGDAFNDYSVPYHLTTHEFNELVERWLAPDGLYMVNLIDGPRHEFLSAYLHTLGRTFSYVYLAPSSAYWREVSRMTYVVIASNAPLDLKALASIDAGDGDSTFTRLVVPEQELSSFLAQKSPVMLTDQFAPVDQMLTSVVRNEAPPTTPTPAAGQ